MRTTPFLVPATSPVIRNSRDAANISRWLASHIALCDEQPRSSSTLLLAPRSSNALLTRSGNTCLSSAAAIIMVGVFMADSIVAFHPHVVVDGARRTPLPHLAPTGSDLIISAHTTSRTAGST